jgi:hypothetical protein
VSEPQFLNLKILFHLNFLLLLLRNQTGIIIILFRHHHLYNYFKAAGRGRGDSAIVKNSFRDTRKGKIKRFFSGAQSNSLTQKKKKKEERRKRNKLLLFWLGQVAVRPLIVHDSMSLPAPKNIYKWPGSTGGLGVTGNHESKKGSRETRTQKY